MALLRDYHEALEYDLQTVCGVDLLDFWRGLLSPRKLWVLIRNLPGESRFAHAFAATTEARKVADHHAALEAQLERNAERGLVQ